MSTIQSKNEKEQEQATPVQRFRKTKSITLKQSMGIALSTEKQMAALSIIQNGYAYSGASFAINPLLSERGRINRSSGLFDIATRCLAETMTSFAEIDCESLSKTEIELLSDIEESATIQAFINVDSVGIPKRKTNRSPFMPYKERKVILDKAAPAPILPALGNKWDGKFEVDLVFLGFLLSLKIDIAAVESELKQYEPMKGVKILSSPAARSNYAPSLLSLGSAFPPAIFSLRGNSLTITRMVLEDLVDDSQTPDHWEWRMIKQIGHEGPILEARSMMNKVNLFRCERRSLSAILNDDRIHPSVRVSRATRDVQTGTTRIYLYNRTVPLMPIGDIPEARFAPPSRVLPSRIWMEPDNFTTEDARQMLVKSIVKSAYDYATEVQDGQILLRINVARAAGRGRHYQYGGLAKAYTYSFIQTDFKDQKTLNLAIEQTFRDHQVAVDSAINLEDAKRLKREEAKIRKEIRDKKINERCI